MRSKYYLADRLPGYLINLSLLNDRYWAGSLRSIAVSHPQRTHAVFELTARTIGSVLLRILCVDELAGAFGCFDDGFDQGDAQFAFFQFHQSVDGTAGRRSDHVFQHGGVRI